MTLFSALRALPDMEVVGLNFSSATTPELLLKTFDHYCEYRKTPNGVVLAPVQVRICCLNFYFIGLKGVSISHYNIVSKSSSLICCILLICSIILISNLIISV